MPLKHPQILPMDWEFDSEIFAKSSRPLLSVVVVLPDTFSSICFIAFHTCCMDVVSLSMKHSGFVAHKYSIKMLPKLTK